MIWSQIKGLQCLHEELCMFRKSTLNARLNSQPNRDRLSLAPMRLKFVNPLDRAASYAISV